MSNPMQDLHTLGLNPFAVTLLAESMLKSAYVTHCGSKPLTFEFPVSRADCAGWAGVRITIEAVPTADGVLASAVPSPVVVLNDEQWAHFVETMNNPAEPTEALKRGARLLDELRAQRAAGVKESGDA